MMPLLRGESNLSAIRDRLFSWHYPLEQPHFLGGRSSAANRKCDYKYIHLFDDDSDELYDLKNDEYETTDMAAQKPEKLNEHKGWLKNWIAEVRGEILPRGGRL
jgi:arylsulfatase A-like enzyme